MTLQELRYVVALADTGHFARAAELCHVTQSTLSTQLKKLEDLLGVVLFDRSLRHVIATPAGREVIASARLIVAEADKIRAHAKRSLNPMERTLNFGVIPTAGPYLFPHVLKMVHKVYPKLRLLLREQLTGDLLQGLSDGKLDAALLALPVSGEWYVEPLYQEAFVAVLPKGHPLSKQRTLNATQLADQRLLLLDEGHCLRDQALEVCGRRRDYNEEVRATSLETLRQMVLTGVGVTLMPKLAVASASQRSGLEVREFKQPQPRRRMGVLWRFRSPHHETLLQMAQAIRTYLPDGVTAEAGKPARASTSRVRD